MADADCCSTSLFVKEQGAVGGQTEADAEQGDIGATCVEGLKERVLLAKDFKNAGNVYYRGGKYRDAAGRYHRALLQLRGLLDSCENQQTAISLSLMGYKTAKPSKKEFQAVRSVEIDCYNNLAACMLHIEPVKYERIKEYCIRVLERQPRNGKALYRAGVACFHLDDCDAASTFLSGAQEIQPGDPNIDKYMQMTKAKLETHLKEEKAMYKAMLG